MEEITPQENTSAEEQVQEQTTDETKDVESNEEVVTPVTSQEDVSEVLQTKGFDYAELQKEFLQTGEISKNTRSRLAEVGITEELVDNYISGQKAKAEQEKNEIASCVGGREKFENIVKWAADNLPKEEIESINQVTDKAIIQIILKDLEKRMEEIEGVIPNYSKGESGVPAKDIFRSQAEMFEAINNPKYRKDEAYRLDVQRKVTASREAGIDLGI